MEIWPNFLIVGIWKAGTTSLYAYLKKTKGIYMSRIKEPRYFNSDSFDSNLPRHGIGIREKSDYLNLFKKVKDEKAIGDPSATYLSDPESARLIQKTI